MDHIARVDLDKCIASGICVSDEPTAFEFGDHDASVPIDGARSIGEDRLRAIARMCPSGAIDVLATEPET